MYIFHMDRSHQDRRVNLTRPKTDAQSLMVGRVVRSRSVLPSYLRSLLSFRELTGEPERYQFFCSYPFPQGCLSSMMLDPHFPDGDVQAVRYLRSQSNNTFVIRVYCCINTQDLDMFYPSTNCTLSGQVAGVKLYPPILLDADFFFC